MAVQVTKQTTDGCAFMMNPLSMQGYFVNEDKKWYIKVTKDCIIWNKCDDGTLQDEKNSGNLIGRRSGIQTSDGFVTILQYYVELCETFCGRAEESADFEYNKNDDSWTMKMKVSDTSDPDENPVVVNVNDKQIETTETKQSDSSDTTTKDEVCKWQFNRTSYVF